MSHTMEMGSSWEGSQIFLHVIAILNFESNFLTSHGSIDVTCVNKFATLSLDYPSL